MTAETLEILARLLEAGAQGARQSGRSTLGDALHAASQEALILSQTRGR